ncbi:MAG TPA: hypothetical protein VFJ94_09155 [Intrasporangium sp.]|uniref:hypothetical protein n=1 Tax=Intrasporangium sp. TaxID=1925024 RepID=UPI002D7A30C8|nr:hypothetical protein [Intrasporangium sp.]HET7398676.1 hypothetical protein [Intrasporangium sp.]
MDISLPAVDAPPTPSAPTLRRLRRPRRLRQLALLSGVVPLLALAACTGDAPAPSAAGTEGAASTTGSATSTSTPAPTTLATSVELHDPALGHGMTVKRVVRNAPWPATGPAGQDTVELVAVEMEWRVGARYSATIEQGMFTLKGSDPTPAPATQEFQAAYAKLGMPAIATAGRGETKRGWLVFKVEPKGSHPLTLAYNRPAYRVSNTAVDIPAQSFPVVIAP